MENICSIQMTFQQFSVSTLKWVRYLKWDNMKIIIQISEFEYYLWKGNYHWHFIADIYVGIQPQSFHREKERSDTNTDI